MSSKSKEKKLIRNKKISFDGEMSNSSDYDASIQSRSQSLYFDIGLKSIELKNKSNASKNTQKDNKKPKDDRLLKNSESFNCFSCFKLVKKRKGVFLKECLHPFCRTCLVKAINEVEPGDDQVNCPCCLEFCEGFISLKEIRDLIGDEEFQEFLHRIDEVESDFDQEESDSEVEEEEEEDDEEEILVESDREDYSDFEAPDVEVETQRKVTPKDVPNPLIFDLMLMSDKDVIPNFEAFECQICSTEVEVNEGILLKNCLHNGCKECLGELVKFSEEFEIKCPYMEGEKSCEQFIDELEMRHVATKEVIDELLKKTLNVAKAENNLNIQCCTPDCEYFVEVARGLNTFTCQICQALNCIPCKAVHTGQTCEQFQATARKEEDNMSEEAIEKEIAAGNAMRCPRCEIPLFRDYGCDYLTCTTCKLAICYITRKPRHPFKKESTGLMIDGCHCKENDVKCHPNCGTCH